jgi:uncharacterized protein YjgD (DUF1641 family)
LKEIIQYIELSKYILAKNKLAELFVTISKSRKLIDIVYFEFIMNFYERFLNNLFITFGFVAVVKEKEQLLTSIKDLASEIEDKVEEINSYISMNSLNR